MTVPVCVVLVALYICASPSALAAPHGGWRLGKDLTVEDLGEPVLASTISNVYVHQSPLSEEIHVTGYLQTFTGLGRGTDPPFQIYDLNLTKGQARIVEGMEGRPGPNATIVSSNGKLYVGTSRPPALLEYDPATGAVRKLGEMSDNYYHGAQMIVEGSDGAVCVGLMGFHAARLDPKTGQLEDLGVMGDGGYGSYGYVYSLQADERYVYCGMGQQPWYLVIYDRQTKTQRQFFRTKEGEPNPYGGVIKTTDGKLYYERANQLYELTNGEAVLLEKRPQLSHERRGRLWEPPEAVKQFGIEVDVSRVAPTGWNQGAVTVRWRGVGEKEWHTSTTKGAKVQPNAIKRLAALPDGTLLGFAAFYGPMFVFDPKTKQATYLGSSPGSLYDMSVDGDRAYLSGYSSLFCDYDLTKPWTFQPTNEHYYPDQNPRRVALKVSGKYNYTLAKGCDGRVYSGQHHERADEGGSLGWYDPKTGESGGLRNEFLKHDVTDVCAISNGALIVASASALEEKGEGKLLVWDPATQALLREFVPLPGERRMGNLMPGGPDEVIGVLGTETEDGKGGKQHEGLLYKVNARTGEVLWRKTAPGRFFAGPLPGDFSSGDRRITVGPDGCGWLFVDQTLSRIHPDDGRVEPVLTCDVAGRLVFAGNDLYVYNGGRQYFGGFAGIKRIRDVLITDGK